MNIKISEVFFSDFNFFNIRILVLQVIRNSSKAHHNRSQDDLSTDNAACGPETILVNYSKGVTRDLNKLRSVEATKDQVSV